MYYSHAWQRDKAEAIILIARRLIKSYVVTRFDPQKPLSYQKNAHYLKLIIYD